MYSFIFADKDRDAASLAHDYLVSLANKLNVWEISRTVIDDNRFLQWSGASRPHQHHYGKHGLLIHTAEVVKTCAQINELYGNIADETLLFYAALFHDIGKVWDYSDSQNPTANLSTPHKYTIHHIARSVIEWEKAAEILSERDRTEVTHAILAHHGQRDWGSPVSPRTSLAWMLHLCDGLSARIYEAKNFLCSQIDYSLPRK